MEENLEEVKEAPIAQKEKKPRSQAQIDAFQKARDKRLLLASQKKIDEAKKISDKVKTEKPKSNPNPNPNPNQVEVEEEEEEVRVVKKPKKKRIIYVESDSEEELIVKRKAEKKELPPPPPAETIKLPPAKPTPVYVFL